MRVLGVLLYLVAMGLAGWAVRGAFAARRRRGLALALLAAVALTIAVVGVLLALVPRFLG